MRSKIWIFLLVLVLSISLADAIKTMNFQETELVSLELDVIDEEGDELTYNFSEPLDENGQWQTTYGDNGEYKVTVTVSDGKLDAFEEVILIVKKLNVNPSIDSFSPEQDELEIMEGESIKFNIEASDTNNDELEYIWKLDGDDIFEGNEYVYKSDYFDAGMHDIEILISDGESETERIWGVKVNKVNRDELIDDIGDIKVNEGEVAKLDLPDFEKYNLEYSVSEPIGDDNTWETDFDDAGMYDIEIEIRDGEFDASRTIELEVVDVDRAPVFKDISNAWIKENQKVTIELEAEDPDGDKIEYIAENMPEGASLEGNVFEFVTNLDTVNKDNALEKVLNKFHILYSPFKITFTAKSNELEVKRNVLIMVKDVNMAPVMGDILDISAKEGEEFIIEANANDPDGDKVTYSYSGWIDVDRHTPDYNSEGTYKVKVVASDGFLTDEKFVVIKVENSNRGPTINDIQNAEIKEGEELEMILSASDPDGESVNIDVEALPEGAIIEDNVFRWTPDHDSVESGSNTFTIKFVASDGESENIKEVNITVYDVNRAPEIISVKPEEGSVFYVGKKVLLEIDAFDPDGDELSYRWKFGLLEEYEAEKSMARTFTSTGIKTIKVVVSDGESETEHKLRIGVVKDPNAKAVVETKKVQEKKEEVVKKEVKKNIKIVLKKKEEKKPVVKPIVKPIVQQEKTSYAYNQYEITHDDKVLDEKSKRFVEVN